MKACWQRKAFMSPCGKITSAAPSGKWETPQEDTTMPRKQGGKEEILRGDTAIIRKQERGRNGYDEEITAFVCTQ